MRPFDCFHDATMTGSTGLLGDGLIARPNPQGFWESPGGESKRVPEAVCGLGRVFGQETRRRVAIIADRCRAMARLDPSVIVLLHDVTVGARGRVIGQV